MSRLEELIHELCPDGVEYKAIGECTLKVKKIKWKETVGAFQYIDLSSVDKTQKTITETTTIDKNTAPSRAQQVVCAGDVLFGTTRPLLKRYCFVEEQYDEQVASTGYCVLRANTDIVLQRWIFHVIGANDFYSYIKPRQVEGSYPSVSDKTVKSYRIPVPPVEVQREIVRILDEYTERNEALKGELATELTARKKQYEYYKDKLFTFDEDVVWKSLGDIAENCDSMRKPITKGKRRAGNYPYYGASGIVDYVEGYIFDGNFLLISEDGANLLARVTPIAFSIAGKNWVNNHAHVLQFDDIYEQKYVEMYLNSMDLTPYITGAAQPKLNQKSLNTIRVPMPPKDSLKETVTVLERFDKLCNDISEGLPAEIEARQKQYEHYRDKLMTFKEKEQ